jgi:hypothetical protein
MPVQQLPQGSGAISNQDTIIKATVKLICPLDANRASQGSGTIIDSSGTVLTNKHVVDGTLGCLVGFISNFNDEPYFGDRQIADISQESPGDGDIAILKIRNPQNKILSYIDVTHGSSSGLRLGDKVSIYGYPASFGTNMTYTSGDFSGTSGSYLKTSAIIEHGNSGGGAYSKDGVFIGIPSEVIKGTLNALGYVLSIDTINSWLGNTSITYTNLSGNNYSRVSSILETIDLTKLGLLQLVATPSKDNNKTTPTHTKKPTITTKPTPPVQAQTQQKQDEISSSSTSTAVLNESTGHSITVTTTTATQSEKPPQLSWPSRVLNWVINLFR